jgi:hypothetical protein
MTKKEVFLWIVFFLIWLVLMSSIFTYSAKAQYITSDDIYQAFKSKMQSDRNIFPDSVIYQITNLAARFVSLYGLAHPQQDTIILTTDSMSYALKELPIWVYRISKVGAGERSWQAVNLYDFGKEGMYEIKTPTYYDFVSLMKIPTGSYPTTASREEGKVYIYPVPTSAEDSDSMIVNYYAWCDTIDNNILYAYRAATFHAALMFGYIRKGRTDWAVKYYNDAMAECNLLLNERLRRIHGIEVVPTIIGGGQ